jgi:outer membrane receptor for Fe3+-dicitrate
MAGKDQDHVSSPRVVPKHTLTTGIGYSVAKTKAQLNRQVRQEALRDQLSQQGHEQYISEIISNLSDPEMEYDSLWVQRLKAAADLRLKLMAKYIPDLKSQELTGPDGGDLVIGVQRKRFDGED